MKNAKCHGIALAGFVMVVCITLSDLRARAADSAPATQPTTRSSSTLPSGQKFLQKLLAAADAGDDKSMYELGSIYFSGGVVPKDYTEAVKWFRKAADAGNVAGMVKLGWIYQHGLGVPKDYTEAAIWFRKAADAGNSRGMNSLGNMYHFGLGVPMNETEAIKWFRKAAALGDRNAQTYLRERGLNASAAGSDSGAAAQPAGK